MTDVRLEDLSLDHVPHIMTWVNDRQVMQYFANRQTDITEEEERGFVAKLLTSKNDRAWSAFDAATGDYIGQCSINQIYWPARNGRLFLVVRAEKQGGGYGTAILQRVLEKAWELGLHKVWLIVRRDNRSSQGMYLKAGFDFEGLLQDEYCVNGTYYDMVRMGILEPSARKPE